MLTAAWRGGSSSFADARHRRTRIAARPAARHATPDRLRSGAGGSEVPLNPRPLPVERIDALLPQTQCGQCGFGACRPYAEAMARGEAATNRCPPGGPEGIAALSALLGCDPQALDPACGQHVPRQLARIREAECIGCAKCLQACPVDAIIGAAQRMHTVLADDCTGCALCVAPCPVDCIEMLPHPRSRLSAAESAQARARFQARQRRLDAIQHAGPACGDAAKDLLRAALARARQGRPAAK